MLNEPLKRDFEAKKENFWKGGRGKTFENGFYGTHARGNCGYCAMCAKRTAAYRSPSTSGGSGAPSSGALAPFKLGLILRSTKLPPDYESPAHVRTAPVPALIVAPLSYVLAHKYSEQLKSMSM